MQLYTFTQTISCPIDGKLKKVFYRTLIFQGFEYTICNGCDVDQHRNEKCSHCIGRITIIPYQTPLNQDEIYHPYVE